MKHWEMTSSPSGGTRIRSWSDGEPPRFRVTIVCEATAGREVLGEFDRAQAEALAEWFGRQGPVRAEISLVDAAR